MKVYGVIILLAYVISPITAQRDQSFNGTCPIVTTQGNFNESTYTGKWYDIKRFNNTLIPGECGNPSYSLTASGFNVTYLSRNLTTNKNSNLTIVLKRQIVGPLPGKYDVYVNNKKDVYPQLVLETDYKNYSVVWGCTYFSSNRTNIQRLSIYSRQKTLDTTNLNKALNVLKKFKIDQTKLRNVEQNDKKCGR